MKRDSSCCCFRNAAENLESLNEYCKSMNAEQVRGSKFFIMQTYCCAILLTCTLAL